MRDNQSAGHAAKLSLRFFFLFFPDPTPRPCRPSGWPQALGEAPPTAARWCPRRAVDAAALALLTNLPWLAALQQTDGGAAGQ